MCMHDDMSEIQEVRNSKKRDGEIRDMKRYSIDYLPNIYQW